MKYNVLFLVITLLATPTITHAQSSLQSLLLTFLNFFNDTLVPFLFGIAFLFFVVNVFRFFILQGDNKDGRENAKSLAVYSVAAFVFLVIFWGIVNLVAESTGLDECTQLTPDYVDMNTSAPAAPDCIPAGT